jgi:hypothetical protein
MGCCPATVWTMRRSPSSGGGLHIDDVRAWKVAALVARAEPRDLVDVGAFLAEHTPDELLNMTRQVDRGIEDEDVAAVGP